MTTKKQPISVQQLYLPDFPKIPLHIKPIKTKDLLSSNTHSLNIEEGIR